MSLRHAMPRNPFLLMTDPEVVFAAVAKSERLGQLERRLCRPLDREPADAAVDGQEGAPPNEVVDAPRTDA